MTTALFSKFEMDLWGTGGGYGNAPCASTMEATLAHFHNSGYMMEETWCDRGWM